MRKHDPPNRAAVRHIPMQQMPYWPQPLIALTSLRFYEVDDKVCETGNFCNRLGANALYCLQNWPAGCGLYVPLFMAKNGLFVRLRAKKRPTNCLVGLEGMSRFLNRKNKEPFGSQAPFRVIKSFCIGWNRHGNCENRSIRAMKSICNPLHFGHFL